jgi:hypothetical protein
MTYKELREKFIRLSGRYDLVTETTNWTDNGANWYLQAGQRMIEQLAGAPKQLGRYFEVVDVGTYYVTFDGCRSIKEVFVGTTTERTRLTHMYANEFFEEYNEPFGNVAQGSPKYYTEAYLRGIPDFSSLDKLSVYATYIAEDTSQMESRGIIIMPPPDEQTQVEIWGNFETYELTNETDENWWSRKFPDLLVFAAMYKLEVSYRNSEGAKDWYGEVVRGVAEIDKEMVAEDSNLAEQMEG